MDERTRRIEELLERAVSLPEPGARGTVVELINALLGLYGDGLARILAVVRAEGGDELAVRLASDELVGSLLLLHDLHPLGVRDRVEEAVGRAARRLGVTAELAALADGAARVRVRAAGCGPSADAVRAAVEEAVRDAAPEIERVEIEKAGPGPALIPVESLRRRAADGGTRPVAVDGSQEPGGHAAAAVRAEARPAGAPGPDATGRPDPEIRCELCAEPLEAAHRHLFDRTARQPRCACRACAVLFADPAAGGGRYRLVPDRRWLLTGFALDDETWAALNIPVQMAFLRKVSGDGRVEVCYPSPAGVVEADCDQDVWDRLVRDNPVLAGLTEDVEALLVNRVRGAREHWLLPIDDCYSLVGLLRSGWRGFTGGSEVWRRLSTFFADLRAIAEPVPARGPAGHEHLLEKGVTS